MNHKPVIGIVTKHIAKNQLRPDTYIRDEVKQAIFDLSGIAIGILPPMPSTFDDNDLWHNDFSGSDAASAAAAIDLCDGIIFQGGGAYDDYETNLAKYCYDHDIIKSSAKKLSKSILATNVPSPPRQV